MLMQITFVLLIVGALAVALMYYRRGSVPGSRSGVETGTLHVTGVSPRPELPGEQYVTISGSLSGPSVVAHEVYGRFAWDAHQWPAPGDRIPVTYPAGKPDHWQLTHPGARPYLGSKRRDREN